MELLALSNGRLLRLVRIEAYARRDGAAVAVAIWQSTCKTCGAAFEITTPAGIQSVIGSKAFSTVNCPAHRKTRSARPSKGRGL